MVKTRIKKDTEGLYLICDGWICRPHLIREDGIVDYEREGETNFEVRNEVSCTHPPGRYIYVKEESGHNNPVKEIWVIEQEVDKKIY